MSRTRARATKALPIAAAALALACSFGGSALATARVSIHHASPAQKARTTATSVRWRTLTLRNGWTSSQSQYGSGDPAVAVQRGIVYLSGSMHQASGTSTWFATLPRGFRPRHNLWLPVYSFSGTEGSLRIAATGQMYAFGGAVTAYTSLAGISYPIASVRLHNLGLVNGWTSSQGQFNSGNPAAGIQGGVVYLAGSMHAVSATGNLFATIPAGLRPAHNMFVPAYTFDGAPGGIAVSLAGRMFAFGQADSGYTSLAGISYPVTSVRLHSLGLVNGWTAAQTVLGGRPTAGIQNGIVYLTGAIHQSSGTSTRFATLPRALRPAHNLWLPIFTAPGVIGSIEIAHNGQMFAFGIDAHNYAGLAGISYPVNS
jgi:hypothetical protein